MARRLALGALTLALVSVVVFTATQALPGSPAEAILGRTASPERVAALETQLGLDKPAISQYLDWVGGVLTGDLGDSLAAGVPVSDLLSDRIVNSLILVFVAALVALPLGVLLGIAAAFRRGRLIDEAIGAGTLVFVAMPEFVIGLLLTIVFATTVFSIFPAVSVVPSGELVLSDPSSMVLPAATLVLAVVPYLARMARASAIEVLESEYVAMARLKGVPERRVMTRHALPNALVPIIQVGALEVAWMAGGIVVVEFLFRYPGVGSALTDAVANRDLPVIQVIVLYIAALYVFLN
ncbi:MAG: peptide ABC transporter permease, partial [Chloroflexi bacterium]